MPEPKARILLVEDDINLGFVIKDNLELQGFAVTLCPDGEIGWQTYQQEPFDICILDVMLPKKDGFALAQLIRSRNAQVYIIFLTAKSLKEDKITGFKAGADDFMTKPFSIEELILRLHVFLRRTKIAQPPKTSYALGNYTFDYSNLLLQTHDQVIQLTPKEADILKLFCHHPATIIKRNEILNSVWGSDDYFMGRSLDVFIAKLRKYLKSDKNIEIQNLHGVGFKLMVHTG